MDAVKMGRVGIWALPFRTVSPSEAKDTVAELEELGYDAVWVPESGSQVILETTEVLLQATKRLVVATGILNIWMHDPSEVATAVAEREVNHPGRFLLGLGVSHRHLVEAGTAERYERPYSRMVTYLDELDAAASTEVSGMRLLAALGPRMLELGRDRTAGVHPYCVPVSHTAYARDILGPGPLLAPELKVVLSTDPAVAREIARPHLHHYLELPNYANNLRRLGWGPDDLDHGGSDRLVDALVAWGTVEQVAARYHEHLAAGADHVCIQVLREDMAGLAREEWRELADALLER
jgi:probable F420-dependent oxidoreductase